jgi:hypothetical protein
MVESRVAAVARDCVLLVDPLRANGRMPVRRRYNKNEEGNMNVLTLMVIIILAYWVIAMSLVAKQKDWE